MRIGRNEPCPCGSGKKYKQCHARRPEELAHVATGVKATEGSARTRPSSERKRRRCNGCTACCGPALQINTPDLVVPKGQTCPHLYEHGCSRWSTSLPPVCRAFTCNYLLEAGSITVAERPDRAGAILQRTKQKITRLAECVPGGLLTALGNRVWGPMVQRDLRRGRPLVASFLDDPHNAESIHVKWLGDKLACELTSCHADGTPILVPADEVYGAQLYGALFVPHQNRTFDAEALVQRLGGGDAIVLPPQVRDDTTRQRHVRFTRRQADFLNALLSVMPSERSGGRSATCPMPPAPR